MTVAQQIESWITRLETERRRIGDAGLDAPISATLCCLIETIGDLYLYEVTVPPNVRLSVDLPLSLVPLDGAEPTEGIVLRQTNQAVVIQANEALGVSSPSVTLVPDQAGQLAMAAARLKEMITKVGSYNLGPAERLVALLRSGEGGRPVGSAQSSALTTVWTDEAVQRRQTLATLMTESIRANKRILLLSPDHEQADTLVGVIARKLKASGLSHKMWISRYEIPLVPKAEGIHLPELGFEAQMHQFYAKSRSEKDSLRRKYERFRELTPLLAKKEQTQSDLDEVRLLEWRHVTTLRDLQGRIAEVASTLTEYDNLPLFQRLGLQAVGKNVESLRQYQVLYQKQIDEVNKEIDVAKARIRQLVPEAAVPRELRQEFDDLKSDVERLGGIKKIRELLAAEAEPNRQAFMQNRRLVAATPARVASDPLFGRVRFDVLVADEAPWIDAAFLLAAAGLTRERIIVSGNQGDIMTAGRWSMNDPALSA